MLRETIIWVLGIALLTLFITGRVYVSDKTEADAFFTGWPFWLGMIGCAVGMMWIAGDEP